MEPERAQVYPRLASHERDAEQRPGEEEAALHTAGNPRGRGAESRIGPEPGQTDGRERERAPADEGRGLGASCPRRVEKKAPVPRMDEGPESRTMLDRVTELPLEAELTADGQVWKRDGRHHRADARGSECQRDDVAAPRPTTPSERKRPAREHDEP